MAQPAGAVDDEGRSYGLGWFLRATGDAVTFMHDGSLPGTSALVVVPAPGTAWLAVFTARMRDRSLRLRLRRELEAGLRQGYRDMGRVPEGDLFRLY